MYIQNTISIHHISSNSGCDMVLKYEPNIDSSKRFHSQIKIYFLIYFIYSMTKTKGDICYTIILDKKGISRNDKSIYSINNQVIFDVS